MKKLFVLLLLACIAFSLCCCVEEVTEDDGTLSFNGKNMYVLSPMSSNLKLLIRQTGNIVRSSNVRMQVAGGATVAAPLKTETTS